MEPFSSDIAPSPWQTSSSMGCPGCDWRVHWVPAGFTHRWRAGCSLLNGSGTHAQRWPFASRGHQAAGRLRNSEALYCLDVFNARESNIHMLRKGQPTRAGSWPPFPHLTLSTLRCAQSVPKLLLCRTCSGRDTPGCSAAGKVSNTFRTMISKKTGVTHTAILQKKFRRRKSNDVVLILPRCRRRNADVLVFTVHSV